MRSMPVPSQHHLAVESRDSWGVESSWALGGLRDHWGFICHEEQRLSFSQACMPWAINETLLHEVVDVLRMTKTDG